MLLSLTILGVILCFGVSQGAMPSATKSKYETYLREFDNQRGQNPSDSQFQANKKAAILFMKSKFEAAGLTVYLQNFSSTDTNSGQAINGTNLIAVLPGQAYKTAQDEVVVLAAHLDTYGINAGGVDNDGTGLVGLLAIAEDLTGSEKCPFNNTMIFAAFDLSETGGSYAFCNSSCGSKEFLRNKATYIGSGKIKLAMVMDCIGNFDKMDNSQHFPQSLEKNFKSLVTLHALSDYWGDYLAISGRNDDGAYLRDFERIYKANKVQHDFNILKFQWNINGVPTAQNQSNLINGFKGGDHMSFWDANINTILLTDTCYNRGYMKSCKNDKACDTISKLNTNRYEFMYSAVYSAMRVTKELTCAGPCASCSPYADCKNNACTCRTGYTGNGINCTEISCFNCSTHADCKNNICECRTGYIGNGITCTVTSCASCSPHADCNNNICTCRAGYTGNGVTCTSEISSCVDCSPHGECKSNACVCKSGYTGDGKTCEKVSSGSSLVFPHQLLISSSVLLSLVLILSNAILCKTE